MNKLLKLIGFFAVMNIAGILGLVGWLVVSGRLDKNRATEIRTMLSETIEAQTAREAEEAAQPEGEEEQLPDPLSIEQHLEAAQEAGDVELQRRLRDQQNNLRMMESLRREQRELDEARDQFQAERDAFNAMRERLAQIEGDEQFRKSLGVYEGMKAPDAATNLLSLLGEGKRDEVVSYLDAMDERKRIKIFTELTKNAQNGLAAQLLEDLRTRGLVARAPEVSSP